MAQLSILLGFLSVLFLVFTSLPHQAESENILFSALYGEGSHFVVSASIANVLARRGHDVTMLISNANTHRMEDPKYSKLSFEVFDHAIPVEEVRQIFYNASTFAFKESNEQFMELVKLVTQRMVDDCESLLSNKDLMRRLERNNVIVADIAWPCSPYIQAVLEDASPGHRTMVSVSATPPWSGYLRLAGSPVNYAYQPESGTGFSSRMTFGQRTLNLFQSFLFSLIGDLTSFPLYIEMGRRQGLNRDIHPMNEMENYDLHLLNIDFSSDFPIPLSPNVIPVGGLTIQPAGTLDKELEAFVQSSGKHGVIVFTLGTYLASITTIRPEIVVMFAEAFRKMPQKIIWQLKELPDWELPSNVKALPWLPQNDLLGHPQIRAFMYQGGNNGFQEACYHGVPIVVIPLQGDQYDVAARIESRGLGKKIDKLKLNTDIIYETLTEVVNNPSYTKVAKEVSSIYRDRPMSAADRAAFWIEHVIKYGGSYMRSPANELTFIQYHLIDVYAFLTAIVIIVLTVMCYSLRFCLSMCCRMIGRGGSKKSKTE